MKAVLLALASLVVLGLGAACGDDDGDGNDGPTRQSPVVSSATGITVTGAFARAPSADTAAAYFTIKSAVSADRLTSVSSTAARRAEVHTTITEGNTSRMEPIASLEIPAGGEVQLKPGGNHVMLMGLMSPLKIGDVIRLELTFEKAGKMTVEATVEPSGPGQQGR